MTIASGNTANADEVMNAFGKIWKNQMQVTFNEAYDQSGDYNSWNAKLVGTGSPQFTNLYYGTSQSDNADNKYGWMYESTNDYYFVPGLDNGNLIYMDIYADDVNTATLSETGSETFCVQLAGGLWRLYSSMDSQDEATNRMMYKVFGTLGSNSNSITGITNLSELRISKADYRDKYFSRMKATKTGASTTDKADFALP